LYRWNKYILWQCLHVCVYVNKQVRPSTIISLFLSHHITDQQHIPVDKHIDWFYILVISNFIPYITFIVYFQLFCKHCHHIFFHLYNYTHIFFHLYYTHFCNEDTNNHLVLSVYPSFSSNENARISNYLSVYFV